jgi:RimJ/RimL family protein N-acetyltransferase
LQNDDLYFHKMKTILETERLILREFTLDDTEFIIELLNSKGWIEYIGDLNIKTSQQAREYLENGPLNSYQKNGYGLALVELIKDKTPIGMCGIINREKLENPDIGFSLLENYTRKGYAFEIAKATLDYAKETLNLPVILAITLENNESSIKLLKKIGFQFCKLIYFPETDETLQLYTN